MKISVIIPVYNVYDYIDKCLDTLVHQTFKDLEIIVVNDGSPDNSEEIIKKYEKEYKNIKYFKKENGGQSSARNYGLKHATGDFIAFIDSDDYVSLDMYQKMYDKAISGNYDMVVCDLNYIYPDKTVKVDCGIKEDTKDIKKVLLNNYPVVWNKLFKKELFKKDVLFKTGVWFEDVEFLYRIFPYVNSIGVIHEPLNQYVQREGSVMKTVNKKIYDYIGNMNGIIEFYKEKGFYDEYKKEIEFAYVRYLYATFIKSMSRYDKNEYMKAVNMAIKEVKEHFPHYRRNSYFYKSLKGIYLLLFNKTVAKLLYRVKGNRV